VPPLIYCTLGNAYQSQGGYAKAIEYHTQWLTIAKEVGDRAGEGGAYGGLGNAYQSQGDFAKAIEYLTQGLRTGASASRIIRLGTMQRPSSTTRSAWRLLWGDAENG
jgi:tetratricopeptide (TPR) repeat protein